MQSTFFKHLLLTGGILLLGSCQQSIECYLVPSVDKASDFHELQPHNSAALMLARNEAEHIQLVFKGQIGETYTLRRTTKDNGIQYSCRQIMPVYGFDDALVPVEDDKVLLTDTIAKLWITYRTTDKTVPGKYNEQLIIAGNGKQQKIKLDLHVYDVTLPTTPSIPATFGIIEKNLIDSTSEEQTLKNKLEWAELCLDYRMNPYFSTWLANSMRHEASSSPWKWDNPRTLAFLADPRFNRFAIPYHSLSHDELDGMLQLLEKHQLLDRAYFYLWDEPAYMNEYRLIGQYAREIHSIKPEAKVLTTFYCGPKDGPYKDKLFSVFDLWQGDTQIFAMSAWALQGNEANADTCRSLLKDNEEWWTYVCMGPGESQPNLLLSMTGYQHGPCCGAIGKSVQPDFSTGQSMPMPKPTPWPSEKTCPRATVYSSIPADISIASIQSYRFAWSVGETVWRITNIWLFSRRKSDAPKAKRSFSPSTAIRMNSRKTATR